MTKTAKLERLHNRGTKYELVADGKYLAGYCNHGKKNILKMLQKNGEAWSARINNDDMIVFASNGKTAKVGRFDISFSGRTQREAIIENELPWFEDAIAINQPIK